MVSNTTEPAAGTERRTPATLHLTYLNACVHACTTIILTVEGHAVPVAGILAVDGGGGMRQSTLLQLSATNYISYNSSYGILRVTRTHEKKAESRLGRASPL